MPSMHLAHGELEATNFICTVDIVTVQFVTSASKSLADAMVSVSQHCSFAARAGKFFRVSWE